MSSRDRFRYIILAAVAVLLIAIVYFGSRMDYTVEDDNLVIGWVTSVRVPLADIAEVTVLDETPSMHRDFGISFLNIRQGTFTVADVGKVKLYVSDVRRKLVLVHTGSTIYGITPEKPEEFADKLRQHLNGKE